MTGLTDDEIRAALHYVASRAPDPAGVRIHLAGLTRRHRQRRALLMAGGGVGVAVAIGVPAVILSGGGPPSVPSPRYDGPDLPDVRTWPNLPSPAPEPAPGPGNTRVPLRYRPTYLPDGFGEVFRIVSGGGGAFQAREWHELGVFTNPAAISLSVAPDADLPISDRSQEITVNGASALLAPPDAEVQQVVWSIGDGLSLSVEARHLEDGWTVVQDVARSIGPDGVAGLEVPLSFGYLPPDLTREWRLIIEPDGDQWVASLDLIRDRSALLMARLGPHIVSSGQGAFVTLASGLGLDVAVPGNSHLVAADDLVRVANGLTVGSPPYVEWIWQR
jgi:hypothetical protein